jgi:putrescine transport system ATP-binding protein
VRDKSYFGSFTVYHLVLASGAVLKVSEGNVDRYRDDAPEEGQQAWATWASTAQVVLVQ